MSKVKIRESQKLIIIANMKKKLISRAGEIIYKFRPFKFTPMMFSNVGNDDPTNEETSSLLGMRSVQTFDDLGLLCKIEDNKILFHIVHGNISVSFEEIEDNKVECFFYSENWKKKFNFEPIEVRMMIYYLDENKDFQEMISNLKQFNYLLKGKGTWK